MAKRKPLVFVAGEIVENKATDTLDGNNIVVTATDSTEERTLKDRFNDIINVKDFGAKGDGVTEDTDAFIAAIAVAEQRNGVVYVPDGTYNITEPIEGEFISFGHPQIIGDGSVELLIDLYNDYVHKNHGINESIDGNKTFTGTITFNGPEIHNGTETHNGPVTFTNEITLSPEATIALVRNLLATENNGFVDPTTLSGKLRIDPNEFIAANGGLSVSSANNINKLKVNLSNANKALLGSITPFLIKEAGGLSIDPDTNKIQSDINQNLDNIVFTIGAQSITGAKTFLQGPYGTTKNVTNSTINLAQGNVFTKTVSTDITFIFSGVPTNTAATFNLILTNGGAYTIAWPSSVKWEGGEVPEFSSEGTDILTFLTPDGGTTWYGTLAIRGAA